MKALSCWQPWASLIAMLYKGFETRSWKTEYRGPLLICAAKKRLPFNDRERITIDNRISNELWHYFFESIDPETGKHCPEGWNVLPFGKALCVVTLKDCHEIVSFLGQPAIPSALQVLMDEEIALGDYRPGRFAWELRNVRRFAEPWPIRGRQGLFEVPDAEIARHELQAA